MTSPVTRAAALQRHQECATISPPCAVAEEKAVLQATVETNDKRHNPRTLLMPQNTRCVGFEHSPVRGESKHGQPRPEHGPNGAHVALQATGRHPWVDGSSTDRLVPRPERARVERIRPLRER